MPLPGREPGGDEPPGAPTGDWFDEAPCGFLCWRDDATIVAANATLERQLGHAPGSLAGQPLDLLLPPGGRIFYQTQVFPLLRLQGQADEIFLLLRSAQGQPLPMLLNAVRRERDGAMRIDGVLVPMRQRRRFEAELVQARKDAEEATRAKDEFLAVVSHELRTPLHAILGWAKVLVGGPVDEVTRARALRVIERNAHAQARLIEDILDYSRIISGKLQLQVVPVELGAVIEAALDGVQLAADARQITLVTELVRRPEPLAGDPARLQQVMWNLLSNAIKFTPPGGQVRVSLALDPAHAVVTVSDTGEGIGADFLPHVFERFRQADSTNTRQHGGLGLGLAIVRHLVELHGGTIAAHSDGPGLGASFTVRLPRRVGPSLGAPAGQP